METQAGSHNSGVQPRGLQWGGRGDGGGGVRGGEEEESVLRASLSAFSCPAAGIAFAKRNEHVSWLG